MNSQNVIIYGAYDRHNYGDLLFPIVLKSIIEKSGKFETKIASTTESDLTDYGALKTISLTNALAQTSKQQYTKLIIAGGEVLTAPWESILGYISPRLFYYPIKLAPHILGEKAFTKASIKITGINTTTPFVISQKNYPRLHVYYNAVGGNEISKKTPFIKHEIYKNLLESSHITVRDIATSEELKKLGIQHDLSPDCAILISDIYSKQQSKQTTKSDYISFHISAHHARGKVEEIARQLLTLHNSTGVRIALLTIGKAPGHSDDAPLDKIHKIIPEISFRVKSGKITDIINCIANSKAYCGSSLHGAITAMAYQVPQVALLPKKVKKLSSYLETWSTPTSFALSDIDNISEKTASLINSFGEKEELELSNRVTKLKSMAYEKINKITES